MARCAFMLAAIIAFAAPLWADDEQSKNNGKNVILVVVDDMGFQAGCYGDKVAKTPGLDRLAETGTRFTRAGCTTASCSASRSVILTGLYNHATGHYGHSHGYNHFSTYDNVPTLPVMLEQAGYRTCSIGKYHVAPEYTYHFDQYRNQGIIGGSRNSVMMADNAVAWMAEDDERPFFLYWCTSDPHRGGGPGGFANFNNKEESPYPGVERTLFDPDDITPPPWLPDQPEVRAELAEYYQAIARLDQGLVKLLDYLDESGHADDTLVIFISDNGPPFPGAKTNLHEPGRNLPLVVRSPDQERRGVVCDATADWADLVPTILDFCDVTPEPAAPIERRENVGPPEIREKRRNRKRVPVEFHGESFLDILSEEHPDGWDETFASHTFHEITMYYPMRVLIEGKWKLIYNIAHQLPYPFASDLYASPTWQGVLEREDKMYGVRTVESYVYRPKFELYNLEEDPWETNNVATDSANQELLERMKKKLQNWQVETDDPWELKWRYE
ncbi:MAG: heparan N-sulfatase [Planctomycetota bacterium]|nr:MAG: heparan N-sulfatase [Planctomycetota bacterium]REJ87766.1 MAG: heparan N-sulfatase [Planctomycetota bacterium]REK27850.1 MAG: heparan N-sulfatase [Planctomycetota bacterium]REK32838.1 MAG: heparan N-sulfatase [Planctomycetota bacterium]